MKRNICNSKSWTCVSVLLLASAYCLGSCRLLAQTAPPPPTGLTASGGNAQITLSWLTTDSAQSASVSNLAQVQQSEKSDSATRAVVPIGPGPVQTIHYSYRIYRGTTPGGEGNISIGSTGIGTYTDNSVTNGKVYYYQVTTVQSQSGSGGSNAIVNLEGARSIEVSAMANGSLPLWPIQFGTANDDCASAVAADSQGNIVVGGGTNGALFASNTGNDHIFLVKYDAGGHQLWTKQFGSDKNDYLSAITTDQQNNIYLVGATEGSLFSPLTGIRDNFIVKYDMNGNLLWSKQFGLSNNDSGFNDIAVDSQGNTYVVGDTEGSLFSPNIDANSSLGGYDSFVIKYDLTGKMIWSKQIGATGDDLAQSIAIDQQNNTYIAGSTQQLFSAPIGYSDAFLAKLGPDGTLLWGKQFGAQYGGNATCVAVDSNGNPYVTGEVSDFTGTIDPEHPDTPLMEVFMAGFTAKFDTSGNLTWNQQLTTPDKVLPSRIRVDGQGNSWVTGITKGSLLATNAGDEDIFTVKYGPNGNALWGTQQGTIGADEAADMCLDALGNAYIVGNTTGSLFGTNAGGQDGYVQRINSATEQMAKAIKAQLPKSKSVVDAFGVRSVAAKSPVKGTVQCAWAGKVVTLNHPSILVDNHPYMYIGYTGIATRHSQIASGKGEHREVSVTSPERQVVVRYGSATYTLNGKSSKM